jgi:formylglycine-generating enzyme required for sulfatase activity
VRKRLELARALGAGHADGGELAAAWHAVLPALRETYGFEIGPQMGLVPLGPDPESGLLEFAHLATGSVPERDETGRLVIGDDTGLVFVLLRGGTFHMGAQGEDPSARNHDPQSTRDEGPVHEVTLAPFFLSKYEMTQAQWTRVAGVNPSYFQVPNQWVSSRVHPVETVSWYDCAEVLDWLGLRLPSEAQWEYGARGATSTIWWTGDLRDSVEGAANLADQTALRLGAP